MWGTCQSVTELDLNYHYFVTLGTIRSASEMHLKWPPLGK